jgi:hypothetical protein
VKVTSASGYGTFPEYGSSPESPFPSEQAKDCIGSGSPPNGYYYAWTGFDIGNYVTRPTEPGMIQPVVNWSAVTSGKAVVRLADGTVRRVPLPAICVGQDDGYVTCQL